MRSVIVCEGNDDLWFIARYLYDTLKWELCQPEEWCPAYGLSKKRKQDIQYLISPNKKDTVAVFSSGGQDRIKSLLPDWFNLINKQPLYPIDAIVIFRDCDDHSPDDLAHDMESWFHSSNKWLPSKFTLSNNAIAILQAEIDEIDVVVSILPVIIPFDEAGAIETLLLEAIEDSSQDGKRIAECARAYIKQFEDNPLEQYLRKQRLVTKAKYSAAISVTNPDHSTKLFHQLMESTPWVESASIKKHMEKVVQLITGQLQ